MVTGLDEIALELEVVAELSLLPDDQAIAAENSTIQAASVNTDHFLFLISFPPNGLCRRMLSHYQVEGRNDSYRETRMFAAAPGIPCLLKLVHLIVTSIANTARV
jgi:hypothetical protein